jgi:hypothetical protein
MDAPLTAGFGPFPLLRNNGFRAFTDGDDRSRVQSLLNAQTVHSLGN